MDLFPVNIEFSNGVSSRIVYQTQAEYDALVAAWETDQHRYSIIRRQNDQDQTGRRGHINLDYLVSIAKI